MIGQRTWATFAVVWTLAIAGCAGGEDDSSAPTTSTDSGVVDSASSLGDVGGSLDAGDKLLCKTNADCGPCQICQVTKTGEFTASACVTSDAGCSDAGPTCTPKTCGSLGWECGSGDDGCGGTVTCAGCTSPATCGSGHKCGSTCDPKAGTACDKSSTVMVDGCPENYGCAAFEGIYYNSPAGCDTATAGSWLEYKFDGTNELGRSKGSETWSVLGDATSAYHCTYVGFASYDPFHAKADGSCFNATAAGYSGANTWVRVTPGTGCKTSKVVSSPGVIQCDGSCR